MEPAIRCVAAVENQSKRNPGKSCPAKGSQGPILAREIIVALPYGVPAETRVRIVQELAEFLRSEFGCAVVYAVHNKADIEANDGHLVVSERAFRQEWPYRRKKSALSIM